VIPAPRRWAAGALLVVAGALASPQLVPVYDGLGNPDEPYRYVVAPASATKTAPPTSQSAQTPVKGSVSTDGFSVTTGETGPQFQLFVPAGGLRDQGGSKIVITATPSAPTDAPPTTTVDGNVYQVAFSDPAGPVTLTPTASIATMAMRATSQKTPQPNVYFRPAPAAAWVPVATSSGGFDVRVATFKGAGYYVLAHPPAAHTKGSGGVPVLPLALGGVLVLLVGVVLVIRRRADAQ
jgi:hypothetical protein